MSTTRNRRKKRLRKSLQASGGAAVLSIESGAAVEIKAQGGEDGKELPRFSMVAYSGGPMRPGGWEGKHPLVLRIDGMESASRIPVHRDHDGGKIIGHADRISSQGSIVEVEGVLSAENDYVRDVRAASRNGFPWQSSVGANMITTPRFLASDETETINGRSMQGPLYVANRWKLKEASFVSLGADEGTSGVAAKGEGSMKQRVTSSKPAEVTSDSGSDVTAKIRKDAATEMERIEAIQTKCDAAAVPELKAQAIKENWTGDKLDLEIYKARDAKLEAMRESRSTGPAIHSHDSADLVDTDIMAAAMHRNAFPHHKEDFLAAEYGEEKFEKSKKLARGMGFHELMFLTLEAAGMHVRRGTKVTPDLLSEVQMADQRLRFAARPTDIAAAPGFSTFSLSSTLSNLQHKALMAVYNEWPTMVSVLCSTVTHTDYKTRTSHRLEGDMELELLPPTGEINLGTLSEETYTNAVKTYAKRMAIDQQTFIDDDMQAFSQLMTHEANAAMRTREKSMFTALLDAAVVGGGLFFDSTAGANKQNHLTGTNLDAAGLSAAKTLIRSMKSTGGNPTMIEPRVLLTSVALEETALNLLQKTTIQITDDNVAAGTERNEFRVWEQFRGRFSPQVSPWLDTGSSISGALDTTWFLIGDKANGGAIEHAQLSGQEAPLTGTESFFTTWGFQTRIIWSWGFALRLPEAIVRVDA